MALCLGHRKRESVIATETFRYADENLTAFMELEAAICAARHNQKATYRAPKSGWPHRLVKSTVLLRHEPDS
jgi:hypothetical protein